MFEEKTCDYLVIVKFSDVTVVLYYTSGGGGFMSVSDRLPKKFENAKIK